MAPPPVVLVAVEAVEAAAREPIPARLPCTPTPRPPPPRQLSSPVETVPRDPEPRLNTGGLHRIP